MAHYTKLDKSKARVENYIARGQVLMDVYSRKKNQRGPMSPRLFFGSDDVIV